MNIIKIRYNTENMGTLRWRALIDGREELFDYIGVNVLCHTTFDTLPDGRQKAHITANFSRLERTTGAFGQELHVY